MRQRAGKLRHSIIIESPVETKDGMGQPVKSWGEYAKVRASVKPLRGREFFAAQQYNSEVTTKILMRFLNGVTTKMRITFNSKIYNIESVINIEERGISMELMCSEGVNNG